MQSNDHVIKNIEMAKYQKIYIFKSKINIQKLPELQSN